MVTLLFTFIPVVGLVFSFTNAVGTALWAAEMEARANLIDASRSSSSSSKIVIADPQLSVGKETRDVGTAEDVKMNE